jgi:hypothetical protein
MLGIIVIAVIVSIASLCAGGGGGGGQTTNKIHSCMVALVPHAALNQNTNRSGCLPGLCKLLVTAALT